MRVFEEDAFLDFFLQSLVPRRPQ